MVSKSEGVCRGGSGEQLRLAPPMKGEIVRIRWRPEMRRRPDMTESPSTGAGGGSLPSFVLTAFLYNERTCARIIL